jgi:hypothetical protein
MTDDNNASGEETQEPKFIRQVLAFLNYLSEHTDPKKLEPYVYIIANSAATDSQYQLACVTRNAHEPISDVQADLFLAGKTSAQVILCLNRNVDPMVWRTILRDYSSIDKLRDQPLDAIELLDSAIIGTVFEDSTLHTSSQSPIARPQLVDAQCGFNLAADAEPNKDRGHLWVAKSDAHEPPLFQIKLKKGEPEDRKRAISTPPLSAHQIWALKMRNSHFNHSRRTQKILDRSLIFEGVINNNTIRKPQRRQNLTGDARPPESRPA